LSAAGRNLRPDYGLCSLLTEQGGAGRLLLGVTVAVSQVDFLVRNLPDSVSHHTHGEFARWIQRVEIRLHVDSVSTGSFPSCRYGWWAGPPDNSIDAMKRVHLPALAALYLCSGLAYAGGAEGQEAPSKDSRNVTVVTLYSESTPAPGSLAQDREPRRPPIQIVDGGVKSAGPSCWTLSDSGQITTVEGECYILRSAAAGEKPPAK
jgi:hypothetical protein